MMFRSFLRLALCTLVLSLFGCSEVTRTQLTFQIAASDAFAARIDKLQVTLTSIKGGSQDATYGKALLTFPVEIAVVPQGGNGSTDKVTLRARALAADGSVISDQTGSGNFSPEDAVVVKIALDSDAITEEDAGPARDAGTPAKDAGDTPTKDAGDQTKPTDSGSGPQPVVNCATASSGIDCDDGNPCNGKEGCNPGSRSALANGCVPSDSPVTCANDMTCDRITGECSSCAKKPDGDGDGVDSIACGGKDCDDNDPAVAPGKSEACDGKDNDCDGTRDGTKADPSCKSSAPKGGTASCIAAACLPACTKQGEQVMNGVCAPPPQTCPIANPCAPGSCVGGSPTYSCTCPAGYRAGTGMTRCAPVGAPVRTIGFEATCDNMATPGDFSKLGYKSLASTLYAACGVASVTSGTLVGAPQLFQPLASMLVVEGITKDTALLVTPGPNTASIANSELAISFSPPVNELSFDILDIDNLVGLSALKVTLRSGPKEIVGMVTPPPAGSKRTRFSYLSVTEPVDLVTITYTPLDPTDALYIDELSYRVGGCGDGVMDGNEACDDGNTVQCDGCDNACALSSTGCLSAGACLAPGATTTSGCQICDATVVAAPGTDLAPTANPAAPASCAP